MLFTAVIAPILVEAFKRFAADRQLYKVSAVRADSLTGVWDAVGIDRGTTASINYDFRVRMSLSYKWGRIKGIGELENMTGIAEVEFDGYFQNDQFLQLRYRSPSVTRRQLGVALFRLSDSGEEMEGQFAGYSPLRQCLVSGSLSAVKRK
jgi:hypothetical protein